MKKYIPYGKQEILSQDTAAVLKTLRSDFITQGPEVAAFEKALAKSVGAKYAVAVSNGTAALHLAYLAAGIQPGDEVITTAMTFVATTNMLLTMGAKPVFCDIRMDTYNIDEEKIEKLITKKTKAIVVVHFAGQPCAMKEILQIAKKHKLKVIEDAAHALGSKYAGSKIGGLKSDMTTFSFHPVKPITTGEGGAITTNSKKYYEKLMLLRTHGVFKNKKGIIEMTELGFNYRITDIQCALGTSQLKRLASFIKRRRQVVKWYASLFKGMEEVTIPVELKGNISGWHLYVILVPAKKRLALVQHLKKNGIGANFHYPPVYVHPYYRKNGYAKTKCKHAEDYFARCITLPLYPGLPKKDVQFVVQTIKDFFNK